MTESTWSSRELPILRAIHEAQETGGDPKAAAREAVPDLPFDVYCETIASLADDGALVATVARAWGGQVVRADVERLTPKGRRAVGQWPTGRDGLSTLLAVLEERAAAEPDPVQRGKVRRAATAVADVGRDVMTEVLARVVERQTGLG